MATRALAKSAYHHGDLESALVEAAITLVRKYGPDHLSLRAVSSDVGVSPSAAYHYFQDKDSLVSAVGDRLFNNLAEIQEKAIHRIQGSGAKCASERFDALGSAYFKWATAEPNLYRLIFGGFCEPAPSRHEEAKAWHLLTKSLDELYFEGLITKSARQGGEMIVWSAVHGACSLIIEGLMPKNSFPVVIKGIQRSLGMK
jgi:AcrR family transcriptional regulator